MKSALMATLVVAVIVVLGSSLVGAVAAAALFPYGALPGEPKGAAQPVPATDPMHHSSDTGGTGSYAAAETWHSLDTAPPPDSWHLLGDVELASTGRIYVSDSALARITAIDPEGSTRVLATGRDAGLVEPRHIALDENQSRLYVADSGADAVIVLGMDGAHIATWLGVPSATGIAVAPDGTVVVTSSDTGEITRFTAEGDRQSEWSIVPTVQSERLIGAIDVGLDGRIYSVAGTGDTLHIMDSEGKLLDTLSLPSRATDVEIDDLLEPDGPTYFWFAAEAGLLRYEPPTKHWEARALRRPMALGAQRSVGVAVGVHGAGAAPSRIFRFSENALTAVATGSWGQSADIAGVLRNPSGVEVGGDGAVYIVDDGSRVHRYDADDQSVTQVQLPGAIAADGGTDGTGYMTDGATLDAYGLDGSQRWAVEYAGDDHGRASAMVFDDTTSLAMLLDPIDESVRRFGMTGGETAPIELPRDAGDYRMWSDIAVDGDGRLHVLDRLAPAVAILSPVDSPSVLPLPVRPERISAGPDGQTFTLGRDGWVRRYDNTGARTAAFDATRFDVALESEPADLAVGGDGSVFVVDRAAKLTTRFEWQDGAQSVEPPASGASCRHYPDKTAAPHEIPLGESVEVRLTLRGGCGSDVSTVPLDVLLILDRSKSMRGDKMRVAKAAAIGFVAELDLTVSRVGVVSFSRLATLESPLSSDEERLRRAIDTIPNMGGTSIDAGILEARREMQTHGRDGANPVFVLLSDGQNAGGAVPVLQQADAAKAAGIEIFTIGIHADEAVMIAAASSADHYFSADDAGYLFGIFNTIAERLSSSVLFNTIEVLDEVPDNMRYIVGSAQPAAAFDDGVLRWNLDDVPFHGFALRYLLQPMEPGQWPTNIIAWGDYTDGFGTQGQTNFPVPTVSVLAPTPTPTNTTTATPTPTATSSPTTTPTPTVTPTPTPRDVTIYLPLIVKEECVPGRRRTDVVLVIDASSSMLEPTVAGRTKIAAAEEAAQTFIDQLELPDDQAAVVAFNGSAYLLQQLTGDRRQLRSALYRVQVAQQTRIDLGIELAHLELLGARRRSGNMPVMIVLTDGRANPISPDIAVARASAAKADGIVLFTIGLGADLDYGALSRMATDPALFYLAPDAEDLRRVYSHIAVTIPCPPGDYWGRR